MRRHILLYLLIMVIVSVLSSFVSAIEPDYPNLLGWWKMDDASGGFEDSKTNAIPIFNMTEAGDPTYQQTAVAPYGSFSIDFDGVGDSGVNTDIKDYFGFTNVTICSWVINDAFGTTQQRQAWSTRIVSGGLKGFQLKNEPSGDTTKWGCGWWDAGAALVNALITGGSGFVCCRYNQTHISGWMNGTQQTATPISVDASDESTADFRIGCGDNNDCGQDWDGKIDEVTFFNESLSGSDILDLFQNGISTPSPPPPGAPETPTIVAPSPANNTVNNTNVTLNVTHSSTLNDVRYYLYFGENSTLTETDLFLNNVTRTGDEYRSFFTNVSDGTFNWKWKVQNITNGLFSANTTQRTWILDTVNPTITINPNNAFDTSNISSHNQYFDFMFLNITFDDEIGLFGVLVNVTQDQVSYFNHTNTSLNNELSHNFTRNVSTAIWPDGVFDIEVTVADGSTVISIEDYGISQFLSRITFNTDEGNSVDIIGSGAFSTQYDKKKDRYEFGFNYLTKETTRKFTVKCDNELFYMNNPNKVGHFVCWNNEKKNGNWIDFGGIGDDYTVKKIKEKEYEITFINLPSSNKVLIKSIGGLNVVTENYQWFKGSTTNIFSSTATSGLEQEFQMNITLDFDLVKNITAIFTYNETLKTITRTDSATSILFNTTFNVPDVNQTLNLSWTLNVTQRNDNSYSFSVNSTQELVSPQINLTVLDEENQTLITEDLTIFFTGPLNIQTNTSSGTLSIGNLLLGEYFIQAESTSYPRRGVFLAVTNESANVNLYLVIDKTGNDNIDYIVQDDGRNRLNNVRLTFQKNINNSFVTVTQLETDFAGQARIFQDQQNEYRIVMSLAGFATQTIDLIPLLTTYTLTLLALSEQLFQTTYEGIRYTISPSARILNASGLFRDISFTIFDGTSSLEFFGLQIINHSYTCIPANCITNITGSPAGGTAVVQINLSEEGSFDTLYFFKRNGFSLQFINGQRSSVRFLIGDRLTENFQVIGDNLGTPVMRSIFAAILITVLAVLASQIGVIGLGLMLVISFGTIFFMLLDFIPRMVAMITLFFGIAIYFVLGREQ